MTVVCYEYVPRLFLDLLARCGMETVVNLPEHDIRKDDRHQICRYIFRQQR